MVAASALHVQLANIKISWDHPHVLTVLSAHSLAVPAHRPAVKHQQAHTRMAAILHTTLDSSHPDNARQVATIHSLADQHACHVTLAHMQRPMGRHSALSHCQASMCL